MSDQDRTRSEPSKPAARPQTQEQARKARLGTALRQNLKRRKAQTRGRSLDESAGEDDRDTPSIFKAGNTGSSNGTP